MKRTRIPANVTRSTKLQGAQRSLQHVFRSTDFSVPENLIFPALCEGSIKLAVVMKTSLVSLNLEFTAQKMKFPLRIPSVNMTKSTGNCGFGHLY